MKSFSTFVSPNDIYADCSLPLDKSKTTIRALDLEPGDDNGPIRGTLRILDIDTDPTPQYQCISYVWGDDKLSRSAIINDKEITIGEILYNALCHIRSKTKKLTVWADAICINQSDVEERSHQVALMVKIYRECSKVFIWLELPQPGSLTGDPFHYLAFWVRGGHFYEFPGFERDRITRL